MVYVNTILVAAVRQLYNSCATVVQQLCNSCAIVVQQLCSCTTPNLCNTRSYANRSSKPVSYISHTDQELPANQQQAAPSTEVRTQEEELST